MDKTNSTPPTTTEPKFKAGDKAKLLFGPLETGMHYESGTIITITKVAEVLFGIQTYHTPSEEGLFQYTVPEHWLEKVS